VKNLKFVRETAKKLRNLSKTDFTEQFKLFKRKNAKKQSEKFNSGKKKFRKCRDKLSTTKLSKKIVQRFE
jgi:hypothetical protein